MNGDNNNGGPNPGGAARRPDGAADPSRETARRPDAAATAKRRTPWPLVVVAVLFVVVPFLTWYGTTFLRPLSDERIEEYLADGQKPRHVQHALEQIDKKIVAGDPAAKRWYPQIVRVASSPVADVRMAAAWAMGDDNKAEEFRAPLLALLEDPEPAVRRMAALSLSRFGEARSRAELLAMLRPHSFRAPHAGTLLTVLPAGSNLRRESLVARVRDASGETREARSPLAGRIERVSAAPGAQVNAGDELILLAPDAENALQALRALLLVGAAEDLPEIDLYARGVAGMPDAVTKQAALTAEAIRARAARKSD